MQTRTAEDAAARAGRRLAVSVAGALAVVVAAVPLGVLVRARWSPLVDADLAVSRAAEDLVAGSAALLLLVKAVTLLGDPFLLTAAAAVLAVALVRRGRTRLALYVVAARIGAVVLSTALKLAVDRARPVFDEPVYTALGASFPSGHALGATVFWTTCAVLLMPYVGRDVLLVGGAVLVSLAVAASRVLLGVHFLSDVTAGVLIGLGWATLCTAVFAAWRHDEGRPVDVVEEGIGR